MSQRCYIPVPAVPAVMCPCQRGCRPHPDTLLLPAGLWRDRGGCVWTLGQLYPQVSGKETPKQGVERDSTMGACHLCNGIHPQQVVAQISLMLALALIWTCCQCLLCLVPTQPCEGGACWQHQRRMELLMLVSGGSASRAVPWLKARMGGASSAACYRS